MSHVDLFFRENCDLPFYSWARDWGEKCCGEIIVIPALILYEFVKPLFEALAKFSEHLYRINEDPKFHTWNALKQLGCFLTSPLIGAYEVFPFLFSRTFENKYLRGNLYEKKIYETLSKITDLYKQEFIANNFPFRVLEETSINQLFESWKAEEWCVRIGTWHDYNRDKDPSELLPYVKKYLNILALFGE
ncbi:MAG: hypothetical protein H0T62_11040 [Parachlamydiaceae bacterium]|nr:hypothetical protein [Parachlamydiaceae bacterium]